MRVIREHLPGLLPKRDRATKVSTVLKFEVQAQGGNNDRSAVAIVTGIVNVLYASRWVKPAPKMHRVIGLLNGFTSVIETAITQQKAVAAQSQILLVISRNTIRNKSYSGTVEFSAPAPAGRSCTNFYGAVHFGVGIRLMAAFIPAPASENTEPIVEWLFEVCAEAVLYGGTQWMGRYFRGCG